VSEGKRRPKPKRVIPIPSKPGKGPPIEEYARLAAEHFALNKVSARFAPKIIGHERAKRALILTLLSVNDWGGSRGRIHCLLTGPPGSGKTTLIETAARISEIEVLSSRLSPGSLTVDFRKDVEENQGAFGQAHRLDGSGVFAIDEFEKVPPESLKHFLRAMESGVIAVPGNDDIVVIPTHWRLIAAANSQDNLIPELVSRFDFKVNVPLPTKGQAESVIDGISQTFMQGVGEHAMPEADLGSRIDQSDAIPEEAWLRGFISWAREFTPQFSPEERRHSARVLKQVLHAEDEGHLQLRGYEAVYRIAFALARLRRRDVSVEIVMDAVEILRSERNWGPRFERQRELLTLLRKDRTTKSRVVAQ